MKNKKQLKEFWLNKEKEKTSKLIISTVAKFSGEYNEISGEIDGLLYLMENGLYFENFKDNNLIKNLLLPSNFKKVEFSIPIINIKQITDMNGMKSKSELTFMTKILRMLTDYPHKLIVSFNSENKKEQILNFYCLDDPLIICEKYYELIEKKGWDKTK